MTESYQERRRLAREWAESFKIGDKVVVKVFGIWQPAIVMEITWVKQWPILRIERPPYNYLIWYRERENIRKLNEEKADAN